MTSPLNSRSIAILAGPTGSGKTSIALEFARHHGDIEIINADSIQFFKDFNIGSAKPSEEELSSIPHHLIDVCEPGEDFTAKEFEEKAHEVIRQTEARGKRVIVVGGSGFYLRALIYGMWEAHPPNHTLREQLEQLPNDDLYKMVLEKDEKAALRIGSNDRYRLVRALEAIEITGKSVSGLESETESREADPRFALFVIDREREELLERVAKRTQIMLDAGFVEEVKQLREKHPSARNLRSVGYKQVIQHLDQIEIPGRSVRPGLEGLADEINLATRQLIKTQRTWFRGQKEKTDFLLDRDRNRLIEELKNIYS